MKAYPKTNMLSDNGKYHEALLMGAIYNNVTKFCAGPEGTGITPEQIKKILKKLGYTNVMKLSDSDGVSVEMIDEISDMLALNKPLFISALPQNVFNGHSWVIDGAKYSENTYLLHFNFGWSGQSNGYFASSSINPAHPVSPDDKENINGKADYPYKSHFRLIRYDIPGEQTEKTLDFDML